jgi:hypothetical protein
MTCAGLVNFTDLTGSITGVDEIETLTASGWLGTSLAQQVTVNDGIGSLSAYGIGATVTADQRSDAGDVAAQVSIGDGGVPGVLDLGNVAALAASGAINQLKIGWLQGDLIQSGPVGMNLLVLARADVKPGGGGGLPSLESAGSINQALTGDSKFSKIQVADSLSLDCTGSLTVTGDFEVGNLRELHVEKNLTANNILVTKGDIGQRQAVISGNLSVAGKIEVAGTIDGITAEGTLTAPQIISKTGNINYLNGGKGLTASVQAPEGAIVSIVTDGDFLLPTGATVLASAANGIDLISAEGNIGKGNAKTKKPVGAITAASIGTIKSGGVIGVNITATGGDIKLVDAAKDDMYGTLQATGGDIYQFNVLDMYGDILARRDANGNGGNIRTVIAGALKCALIQADGLIANLTSVGHDKVADAVKAQIKAEGGGTVKEISVPGTNQTVTVLQPGTLNLEVGVPAFQGTITFGYGTEPANQRPVYTNGMVLLNLTVNFGLVNKTATTWTLNQQVGNANGVYLKQVIWAGQPILKVNKNMLFTQLNTDNTATTDWTVKGP